MLEDSPPSTPAFADDNSQLLTWLSTHDAPCPACKYNLRNLTVPRCPECGRPLSLAVTVIEPYLRSWIVLIVLLCLNAGPGIFLWIGLSRTFLDHQRLDFPPEWWLRFLIIFYLAVVPAAAAALFLRRPFVRLSRQVQLYIVSAVAAITLAAFVTVLWQMAH